mmetsp:Transcript_22798/g.25730  ORF Transcript_22798/g.25730 Transcript_22798/m.25730 type:complete len:131 (-) Transcript_22798:226-618(-)
MVQRVTYRRKCSYRTKSNRGKILRTPGGKYVFQYVKKTTKGPQVQPGDNGDQIHGVKSVRPNRANGLRKRQRRVSRPYGGVFTGDAVRERIVRAFLTEEVKLIKSMMKSTEKSAKEESAPKKDSKKKSKK